MRRDCRKKKNRGKSSSVHFPFLLFLPSFPKRMSENREGDDSANPWFHEQQTSFIVIERAFSHTFANFFFWKNFAINFLFDYLITYWCMFSDVTFLKLQKLMNYRSPRIYFQTSDTNVILRIDKQRRRIQILSVSVFRVSSEMCVCLNCSQNL